MAYEGTVELISGIRPKNDRGFPLVDAPDVRVTDDERLDAALAATVRFDKDQGLTDAQKERARENIGAGEVDATLSVEGMAADAKKTGDELTSLKGDLSEVKLSASEGRYFFDIGLEVGSFNRGTPIDTSETRIRLRSTEYYNLITNVIKFEFIQSGYSISVQEYNDANSWVGESSYYSTDGVYSVRTGTTKVKFLVKHTPDIDFSVNGIPDSIHVIVSQNGAGTGDVVSALKDKLDLNQGSSNAGRSLIVGDTGTITVGGKPVVYDADMNLTDAQKNNVLRSIGSVSAQTVDGFGLKNLIGPTQNTMYPVYIPAGSTITMSLADGTPISTYVTLFVYDRNKTRKDFYTLNAGNISRQINLNESYGDIYFLAFSCSEQALIQVELGGIKTTYQPYYTTIAALLNKFDSLSNTLKVCTYNVGYFSYGVSPTGIPNADIDTVLPRYRKVLGSNKFDVLAMQEYNGNLDRNNSMTTWTNLLVSYFSYSANSTARNLGIGSKHQTANTTTNQFSTGRYYTRSIITFSGKDIAIYNVHFTSGSNKATQRSTEATELIALMSSDDYCIACGDFNPEFGEEATLFKLFTDEGFNIANCGKFGKMYTWAANRADLDSGTPTGDVFYLDNIITSSNIAINYADVLRVYNQLSSDHIPLFAEVSVN